MFEPPEGGGESAQFTPEPQSSDVGRYEIIRLYRFAFSLFSW
jgi:hypothetical protein